MEDIGSQVSSTQISPEGQSALVVQAAPEPPSEQSQARRGKKSKQARKRRISR